MAARNFMNFLGTGRICSLSLRNRIVGMLAAGLVLVGSRIDTREGGLLDPAQLAVGL